MSTRYIVCDTSMLDSYLKIPGKDQHADEVCARMDELANISDVLIFLPWAAVIECGNHIVQVPDQYSTIIRLKAMKLSGIVQQCLDGESPFSSLGVWDEGQLREVLVGYPDNAMRRIGMGDSTILSDCKSLCAKLQLRNEQQIELWTYDEDLKNQFLAQRSTWMVGATGSVI